jgi:hypothetical protein
LQAAGAFAITMSSRLGEAAAGRACGSAQGVVVLGALAGSAIAYVRMRTPDGVPLAWRRGCPAFSITTGGGAEVSADEMVRLIETARVAWQSGDGGCDELPIEVTAGDRGGTVDYDGSSELLWRDADFCSDSDHADDEICLSPNAAAVTTVFFYEQGERGGEIVETDMEINGAYAFGLEGEADRVDLLSIITHELGHAMGLEHTCETIPGRAPLTDSAGQVVPSCFPIAALPAPVREATMFPYVEAGVIDPRTPLDDERRAVCDLYRDHAGTCGETGPGCGCGGAGGRATGALALLLAAQQVLIAARRSGRRPRRVL